MWFLFPSCSRLRARKAAHSARPPGPRPSRWRPRRCSRGRPWPRPSAGSRGGKFARGAGTGVAPWLSRRMSRWLVLGGAAGVLLLTVLPLANLGSEFMPPLNEGSLMYMPNTLPALSLTTQRRLLQVEDSILMTFPEVESVWGKAGRANTATDWAPMSMVETVVNLKPESEWRGGEQERPLAPKDQPPRLLGAPPTRAEPRPKPTPKP